MAEKQSEVGEPPVAPAATTTTVVVTTQPPLVPQSPQFRDYPVWITDSKGNQVLTELRYTNGLLMWVAVGLTCLIASSFLFPCIGLVPLCIKSFKDVEHINPTDGTVVGKYDRGKELGL